MHINNDGGTDMQYTENQHTSSPKFILTMKENTNASRELVKIELEWQERKDQRRN